jgi:prepilin-type processing-associated H-X9-DG protein/prepilin-type N-terminal cleavage/methylation domain-containing protein
MVRFPLGRGNSGSFTLVELLVVIVIIGLLAGLSFPAISGAMAKAKSSECVNNLRQIGTAMNLFASENNGYLPYASGPNAAGSGDSWAFNNWQAPLAVIMGVGIGSASFPSQASFQNAKAKHPFNCPACKTGFRTYTANMRGMGFLPGGNAWPRRKIASLVKSSQLILVADDTFGDPAPANGGQDQFDESSYTNRIGIRHGGRANALFGDFHVESVSVSNLVASNNINRF